MIQIQLEGKKAILTSEALLVQNYIGNDIIQWWSEASSRFVFVIASKPWVTYISIDYYTGYHLQEIATNFLAALISCFNTYKIPDLEKALDVPRIPNMAL